MLGTVLEGHADHVMDAVGPDVVPSVVRIRKAFDARRHRKSNPVQRVVRALLGIDAKMAQYVRGKVFVDTVVAKVGMDEFTRSGRPRRAARHQPRSMIRTRGSPGPRVSARPRRRCSRRSPRFSRSGTRCAPGWPGTHPAGGVVVALSGGADSLALRRPRSPRHRRCGPWSSTIACRTGPPRSPPPRPPAHSSLVAPAPTSCPSTSPDPGGLEAAARAARYAALDAARAGRPVLLGHTSTTRPRPCCWASLAAPVAGRSAGWPATTRRGVARCWGCAATSPVGRAPSWAWSRTRIRTTRTRHSPGPIAHRGAAAARGRPRRRCRRGARPDRRTPPRGRRGPRHTRRTGRRVRT